MTLDGVNGVDGAQKVTVSDTPGERKVVEQKPEEMFDYGSENDIGDGVALTTIGVIATGAGPLIEKAVVKHSKEAPTDNGEDDKADKSDYSGNYFSDVWKLNKNAIKLYGDIPEKGFSAVMREQKEDADKYIEKHPIMSWFDGTRWYSLVRKAF